MTTKSPDTISHRIDALFGVLVFLSGMAALTHQLLWTRRLIDLLGASSESSARVFGTFFLGLSIGSATAALVVRRVRSPLRFAGWVQLSIPLLVIPVIFLSELTDWIWPTFGAEATHGSRGYVIKSLLTLGFVFPPSAMMGLSFPLIVAGVLRRRGGELGRSGINLYAINTLGGASGVLFTVMVALPGLGNFASMVLAAVVDGTIGLALLLYARSRELPNSTRSLHAGGTQDRGTQAKPFTDALGLAFFSGMAVLALEVAAFQMIQLVATISLFAPAAVLFCAIASLGTAAALFSRFESLFVSNAKRGTIVLVLAAAGFLVVLAPQIFMGVARRSNWFADNEGVFPFVLKLGALAILSVGPAWLVGGLIFPFAVARAGEDCSPARSGQRLGLLLAVNGLGGLLGAELTYRVLLPAFGVYGAISVIGLGMTLAALTLALLLKPAMRLPGIRTIATCSVLFALVLGQINPYLPVVNPPPGVDAVDVQSGREGTVAVIQDRQGNRSILVANQYLLGGTSVRYDQERQVLLPLVLHERPVKVACIGLATGITPGAALTIPSVEEVTAIEISPLVAKAADTHFRDFNHNICRHEAASVVIGDGRTYVTSFEETFDLVTGDLFLPWAPGTARLYSHEHFASVRRALKAKGIFCQWLPMYQLTPDQFRRIANTFASEFEETHLFINHFRTSAPMLALVAGKAPWRLDWEQVGQRCDRLRESRAISDPVLRHESGVRMLYLGRWQTERDATQLVSLADPSLEYSAATVRLSSDPEEKYFFPAKWVHFCRSRQQRIAQQGPSSSTQARLTMLATGLLELEHASRIKHELTDSIGARVAQTMPSCFGDDLWADWDRWPGVPVIRRYDESRIRRSDDRR